MKEAAFQSMVIDLAHMHGWIVAHFRPGRTSSGGWETAVSGDGKGFPDLFMLRPSTGHRIAAELKVGKNKKTREQNMWLDAMEDCGIPAFYWTPSDWTEIEFALTMGALPLPPSPGEGMETKP